MLKKKTAKKTLIITGAAGAVGRALVQTLQELRPEYRIFATDIANDPNFNRKVTYRKFDIRSKNIRALFEEASNTGKRKNKIHSVIHLASIVKASASMSESFIEEVDVGGTGNILGLCNEFRVNQLIVTSSGAAYGYHEDNPAWITEDDPIRGNQEFIYSRNKRKIEQLLAAYSKANPIPGILIFRPGTILGSGMDNQITDLFKKKRVLTIKGSSSPFVIIEDKTVAEAIILGIDKNQYGAYNLAGTDSITLEEMAALLGKKLLTMPAWLIRLALSVLHPLRLSQYGPEQVKFLQYRPVLSNDKIRKDFGMEIPSSRSVFEKYLYLFEDRNKS